MELLRLFHERDARGTFFILGSVAEKHPGLIRRILDSGHEIASHGSGHRMVTRMTPREFREDIRKSRRILEDITGKAVLGYRAPTFSIVKRTEWPTRSCGTRGSATAAAFSRYGMIGTVGGVRTLPAQNGRLR